MVKTSDLIERVAKAIAKAQGFEAGEHFTGVDVAGDWPNEFRFEWRELARAAIDIVLEDCALIAENEIGEGTPAHEYTINHIAHRIRSAMEDSRAHAEIVRLAAGGKASILPDDR